MLLFDDMEPEYRQLVEEFAKQPKVFDLPRLTVWFKPGGMLYLSPSWFHKVLSFGDKPHIAVNYLCIPPFTNNYDTPIMMIITGKEIGPR